MKKELLLVFVSFLVFSCEEDDFDMFDSGLAENALEQRCVRYVDRDIEEPGDGLSWDRALPTVEEAIESAKEEVGDEAECEVLVKGELEEKETFTRLVPQSGNIKIVDRFDGTENINNLLPAKRISSQVEKKADLSPMTDGVHSVDNEMTIPYDGFAQGIKNDNQPSNIYSLGNDLGAAPLGDEWSNCLA